MKRPAYLPAVSGFDDQTDEEAALAADIAAKGMPSASLDDVNIEAAPQAQARPAVPPEYRADLSAAIDAKLADTPPPPPPGSMMPPDDDEADRRSVTDARERDDRNRLFRGIEMAGKQLTAGVLRQPMAEVVGQNTDYEGRATQQAARNKADRYQRGITERNFAATEEQRRVALAHQKWAEADAARRAERQAERDRIGDVEKDEDQEIRKEQNRAMLALTRMSTGRADEKDIEGDVQKLAKETGDTAPLIAEKLARVKDVMARHPDDLPGVGPLDSRKPAIALDSDAQSLQSDARELVNTLLFLQSGAGVSNQERENKYMSYGVGKGSTEVAFRQGMAKLENDIAQALRSKQAGFRPAVIERFTGRGGVSPEQITGAGARPAATGKIYKNDKGEQIRWNGSAWEPVK